jgi:hypothetical protein
MELDHGHSNPHSEIHFRGIFLLYIIPYVCVIRNSSIEIYTEDISSECESLDVDEEEESIDKERVIPLLHFIINI